VQRSVKTKIKKHLGFHALRQAMSEHCKAIEDPRQSGKCNYSQHDILMSAFACMYFQDPSLLHFQQRLEKKHHRHNLQSLFGVSDIPQDSQMRDVLDSINSDALAPVFSDFFERLRRHKHLDDYALLPGMYLCSIDGTQYHSSSKVHCSQCLHRTHKNGDVTYSHSVLQGAIMHPDKKQVIPVMPEAIHNTDGSKKQDCEYKAAKRFIERLKQTHPRLGLLLCGDGLFSRQPMIETVLANKMHFLFVAKPDDHKYLMEWLAAYRELPHYEYRDEQGRRHLYRWQNQVPLHGGEKAPLVNYLDYQMENKQGKVTFRNSWVTDISVTEQNIQTLVKGGRCRWKIENECFNTLKNQGYYIEHNYGHGKQYLSYSMYLLTLLAFYFHQIFELTDATYQACRKSYGSKTHLWENFRVTIRMLLVDSWEHLMDLLLNEDDYEVTAVKKS
jgi:hypothetical protein